MTGLEKYVNDTLGIAITVKGLPEEKLRALPLFLKNVYNIKATRLFDRDIVLLVPKENETRTADQYRKHIQNMENTFNLPVVLILDSIEAYNRKRLIEKQIAFIVPGKHMFIPQLMIDLREFRLATLKKHEKIRPAAQCLLIYHLLKENIERLNLKKIAEKLNYTPMTITRAVNEFADKGICRIEGTKEKKIVIGGDKKTVWETALPYLQDPVKRTIYSDEKISGKRIFVSGDKALSYYTNMAGEPMQCFAISNSDFLDLKKSYKLTHKNKNEESVCLEIWKYDPGILAENDVVDPLSLFLSFKDTKDERIEMEIEKMVARLW